MKAILRTRRLQTICTFWLSAAISSNSLWIHRETSEWTYGKDGEIDERTIVDVRELFDVSPVTFPAYLRIQRLSAALT